MQKENLLTNDFGELPHFGSCVILCPQYSCEDAKRFKSDFHLTKGNLIIQNKKVIGGEENPVEAFRNAQ